jgi:SAM-dependent methyltransferase
MLQHAERFAIQHNIKHQCTFLQCPAENLKVIADASVDVITARAVLAYVADKNAAIREFYRVLRPGGRISIAEPIFRDDALSAAALKNIVDTHPLEPRGLFTHLLHRWKAAQFPDTMEKISESPIANYSERDLVRFAHASGFVDIHMELHIDVLPSAGTSWKVFIESSPHPWAPPLSVILAEQFTSEEREFFEKTFRPQVESPQFCMIDRIAYLNAMKPL